MADARSDHTIARVEGDDRVVVDGHDGHGDRRRTEDPERYVDRGQIWRSELWGTGTGTTHDPE